MGKQQRRSGTAPVTQLPEAYLDPNGCRIEISEGPMAGSGVWGVYRIAPGNVSMKRIDSPSLPETRNRRWLREALARYAEVRAWRPAEVAGENPKEAKMDDTFLVRAQELRRVSVAAMRERRVETLARVVARGRGETTGQGDELRYHDTLFDIRVAGSTCEVAVCGQIVYRAEAYGLVVPVARPGRWIDELDHLERATQLDATAKAGQPGLLVMRDSEVAHELLERYGTIAKEA